MADWERRVLGVQRPEAGAQTTMANSDPLPAAPASRPRRARVVLDMRPALLRRRQLLLECIGCRLHVVGRSFYGFGGWFFDGDLLFLRSHLPLLICVLIK